MHRVGEGGKTQAVLHSNYELVNELAGRGPEDVSAEDFALGIGDDLYRAVCFAVAHGTVEVGEREAIDAYGAPVLLPRLIFGHANARQLGIREGAPRHDAVVHLAGAREQNVADHDLGLRLGDVCKQIAPNDIPGRIDVGDRRAQLLIDDDSLWRNLDADALEIETFDVRSAAGGHNDGVHGHLVLAGG